MANLGPGFDTLGMALNLYNTVELEETSTGRRIEVAGEGEQALPRNENNLVAQAINKLFKSASCSFSGWSLRLENNIPLQRGLGSSAAAIVGGLVAANFLAGNPFSREQILSLAIELEGHPDNVAAALLGGVVVIVRNESSCTDNSGAVNDYLYSCFYPPRGLKIYAVVPEFTLSTKLARSVLPEQVPLKDAVFNLGRVALLITALRDGNWEQLGLAVQDRLHQTYRAHLIPGLEEMFQSARLAGAFGTFLSGAGPSVVALGPAGSRAGEEICRVFQDHGIEARVLELQPSSQGAYIETSAL